MDKTLAEHWKKIWHFIWKEDSFASLVVNIILAVILIKFVIYPLLGLLFGTAFPVVAVVSSSMEHHPGNFEDWWEDNKPFYMENNIYAEQFREYPFPNGFHKGDIMILVGVEPEKVKVGEVIVFRSGKPYPIIHRVVVKEEDHFETKGDNNNFQINDFDLNEKRVLPSQLIGKAVFRIPWLGYIKIWFVDFLGLFGLDGILQG